MFPFAGYSTSSNLNDVPYASFNELGDVLPSTVVSISPSMAASTTSVALPHTCPTCTTHATGSHTHASASATSDDDAPTPNMEAHETSPATPSSSRTLHPTPHAVSTPVQQQTPTSQPTRIHPMVTRSCACIFKPKYIVDLAHLPPSALHHALLTITIPKGYKSASKHPHWLMAMEDEILALKTNNTWDLVPRPNNANIVGSKWIFCTKLRADSSVERLKARLVAQGSTQIPGLDFSYTFSPVIKASTVHIVLSLAVLHKWPLHQLDVKNAFLNGHLFDTVFMEQPPGYLDERFPNHVCHLKKALYGLKQAPQAWFQRLSTFLLSLGFVFSRADTSLFVFQRHRDLLYILVYIDDIIVIGNNSALIKTFITPLKNEFATKDLGNLTYFLGLEVTYPDNGLFLTQTKYAHDILTRASLLESKPVFTPLSTSELLTSHGSPFSEHTLYKSLIGALQYLTITRPDLSYAVNQVSQFLHAPTNDHFQAVKRVLRYVKGTISYGLYFSRPTSTSLVGYSDADWARCIETRRSTYGYSIFLGGNLVSWSAKK